eukprot:COSAG02_NODE_5930_length_3934_cov_3.672836_3_plen_82_part_00
MHRGGRVEALRAGRRAWARLEGAMPSKRQRQVPPRGEDVASRLAATLRKKDQSKLRECVGRALSGLVLVLVLVLLLLPFGS